MSFPNDGMEPENREAEQENPDDEEDGEAAAE
jgi:hypothetical protein